MEFLFLVLGEINMMTRTECVKRTIQRNHCLLLGHRVCPVLCCYFCVFFRVMCMFERPVAIM